MPTMDTAERRLPALGYLDSEKARYNKDDAYQSRTGSAAPALSISSITSPVSKYPSGPATFSGSYTTTPATPYSASWHSASGIKTPPGSRRSSGDEKEEAKPSTRQSLPSISDVLAHEPPRAYPTTQPLQSSTSSASQPTVKASPSPRRGSIFGEPPLTLQKPFTSGYNIYRPEQPHDSTNASSDTLRSTHKAVQEPHSASYPPVSSTPHGTTHTSTEQQYGPPPASAGSNNYRYGQQTPYQPLYASQPPPPPPPPPGGPLYQPSAYVAPPTWKPLDGLHRLDDRPPIQVHFGESVKRKFEMFDFEVALTEIAHGSGALADFARRYGDQMHRSHPASSLLSGSLPSVVEIDDMISKSRIQHESLSKIRELIITQQAAFEQQAADQRQQAKAFSEQPAAQSDLQQAASEDGKAFGYTGGDAKKRRGRAAPPGRCHSCNRAETPEWRRGPDGARTLCNACGLHYAKLTRKNNYQKQNTAPGSSNLRPKENVS